MEGRVIDKPLKADASVHRYCEMFEQAEWTTQDARRLSERDRDYYDGKQLTDAEIKTLEKRKQPPVVYNRIQRKVDFLSGLEKQQRKDPKAFPRTPNDEGAADAATDAIRYVCDDQRWDMKRSKAWKHLQVEGTAAIIVDVQEVPVRPQLQNTTAMTPVRTFDPRITTIPWDRFFYDPQASDHFFSDARYMGIVTWYDLSDAMRLWPDAEDALAAAMASGLADDTYEDKPRVLWVQGKERRVRVVEMYYKEGGQWMRCVYTKGGFLEEPAPSEYLDEDGLPENPIKAASLYVDRDNNRYGSVRVLISPQDEINKRRSKALHRTTMRQVRVGLSASADKEKIRNELNRPDGVITAEKDDFEILPGGDLLSAEIALLQEAKGEIDLLGANSALAGKNENDMSGRAILAQQQGGMVEVADQFDTLRELTLEVYRAVWNRIRQVWTAERWIRVTENERNLRFVGLNQQVTVQMLAEEVAKGDQQAIAKAAEIVGPQLMQAYMAGDQQAQMMLGMFVQQNAAQVVEVRNAINELDVDIVIDEGMDTPTVQAEQFDALVKMLPAFGPFAQDPRVLMMIVEASQLRDKDKLIEYLEQAMQGPSPEEQQLQETIKQLQIAGAAADVDKTKSEAVKNIAQAQNAGAQPTDPMERVFRAAEIETDQYNAVTDRMQAMQPEHPREAA
jgi:hypothetical protein